MEFVHVCSSAGVARKLQVGLEGGTKTGYPCNHLSSSVGALKSRLQFETTQTKYTDLSQWSGFILSLILLHRLSSDSVCVCVCLFVCLSVFV